MKITIKDELSRLCPAAHLDYIAYTFLIQEYKFVSVLIFLYL